MDEQELIALPEITDLTYTIEEHREERGPHELCTSPIIALGGFTARPAYEYFFQFDKEPTDDFSWSLTEFIRYRFGSSLFADWLKHGSLDGQDYGSYFRRANGEWWVLNQGLIGPVESQYQPVARIREEVLREVVARIREFGLSNKH